MASADILNAALAKMPIVCILANLPPSRAAEVGLALVEAGVSILEVPLRGNDIQGSLESIRILASTVGGRAVVGAGTVLRLEQVREVKALGARLIVSPNCDEAVISETIKQGLISLPGVFTPTEAFFAIKCGATALKWFPTDGCSPKALKAMLAVLPAATPVLAVGGVDIGNVAVWHGTGAKGFGVGSAIWKPTFSAEEVRAQAAAFVAAVKAARTGGGGGGGGTAAAAAAAAAAPNDVGRTLGRTASAMIVVAAVAAAAALALFGSRRLA